MTDRSENQVHANASVEAIQAGAKRAMVVQSEFSEKLIEASKHWMEQIQTESNEAWELFRKLGTTTSVTERIETLQDWIKGVTLRSAEDATYFIETARALGNIELNLFASRTNGETETSRKAA
ncbi:hypothetical protein CO675_22140 [Bradyrhizobium sp. C9]|nr:hypothetical protein CO675_22140 [Bradyrhizobium sp. C9]